MTAAVDDPDAAVERRLEVARSAGVPEEPLRQWARGAAGPVLRDRGDRRARPRAAAGRDGARPTSGRGRSCSTPGHAPSHVCLWQPERRLLISGDHLLGRVSPYYDYGYTPDPAGEFLTSLDRVEALDARLCLAGHGRTFTDVQGHIAANRELIARRLGALEDVLREDGPVTAFDAVPRVFGEAITPINANWWLSETLCYLRHLQVTGRAEGDGAQPRALAGSRAVERSQRNSITEGTERGGRALRLRPRGGGRGGRSRRDCVHAAAGRADRVPRCSGSAARELGAPAFARGVAGARSRRIAAARSGAARLGAAGWAGSAASRSPASWSSASRRRGGLRRRPASSRLFAGALAAAGASALAAYGAGAGRRPRARPPSSRARPCARRPCAPPAWCARRLGGPEVAGVQEQEARQQQAGEGEHHGTARPGRRGRGGQAAAHAMRRGRRRAGASARGSPSARAGRS